MQAYRSMPILTQAPSSELRARVPHHLVGFLSPRKEFNAALFVLKASRLIDRLSASHKVPLVVGGAGLYYTALLDGLFKGPGENSDVRRRLEREAALKGTRALYSRLKDQDPQAAATIHLNDLRRLVRALEVIQLTRKKISQIRSDRKGLWDPLRCWIYGLRLDRSTLYHRIEERVDRMFDRGLLLEARKVLGMGLSKTARMCLGLREAQAYLDGQLTLEGYRNLLKQKTRQFAKRQIAWFKRDPRIRWIDVKEPMTPQAIADVILRDHEKKAVPDKRWSKPF